MAKKSKRRYWKKQGFEFLSIFIAVVSAFALNNWNDNRRDAHAENKILIEISNGLEKDLEDINLNKNGHITGIRASDFFKRIFIGNPVAKDSVVSYFHHLTRDYVSIQNVAGYQTLKSRGLELIENDSLRLKIISLYEYDYNSLLKLEEQYSETQFHKNYFNDINDALAPNFRIDSIGNLSDFALPLVLSDSERNKLLIYLWKIKTNRTMMVDFYGDIEEKIVEVMDRIKEEID